MFQGKATKGYLFLGFSKRLPILTIMGGSLGAKRINEEVRKSLPELTKLFQIVHICGRGQIDSEYTNFPRYKQLEYIMDELPDILAATDLVLTRGGSNAIFEFLSLQIPMLIIPLPKSQSRGDQILNAISFQEKGYALMLEEDKLTSETLIVHLIKLQEHREKMIEVMKASPASNAVSIIVGEIEKEK